MRTKIHSTLFLLSVILFLFALISISSICAAQDSSQSKASIESSGDSTKAQNTDARRAAMRAGFGRKNVAPSNIEGPSVVKGKPAGIAEGEYAPDFQLETVKLYPEFNEWLGDKAPKKFDDEVLLSDFVGQKPIVLLFGSYT